MRSRPLSLAVFSFQPYRLSQLLSAIMVGGITILALPLHAQQQDEQRLSVEQRQACRSKAAQAADPEEQKRLFRKCRREILDQDQSTLSSAPAAAPPVVAAHPSVAAPAPVAAPTMGPVVAPTVAAAPSVAAPTTGPVVAPTVAAAPSVAAPAPVSAPIAAAPAVSAAPVVPASVATPPTSNEPAANDLVEVVAQGMGTDANSALNNAYSNAVQQALGLYVDAETMVQNDQVVRDQILTYSRGFIQKTDTISEGQENGLFQVKIRAQVQRQQLLEKAKASNISVKPVQGATLYAQIKSQSKQVEDAGNLIKKAFEPLTKIDFYR